MTTVLLVCIPVAVLAVLAYRWFVVGKPTPPVEPAPFPAPFPGDMPLRVPVDGFVERLPKWDPLHAYSAGTVAVHEGQAITLLGDRHQTGYQGSSNPLAYWSTVILWRYRGDEYDSWRERWDPATREWLPLDTEVTS